MSMVLSVNDISSSVNYVGYRPTVVDSSRYVVRSIKRNIKKDKTIKEKTKWASSSMSGFSGNIFEDFLKALVQITIDIFNGFLQIVGAIFQLINSVVFIVLAAINNFIQSIDWNKLFEDLKQFVGNIIAYTNPVYLTSQIMKNVPILKDIYSELNKLTGGFLDKLEFVSTVPGRLVKGDQLTKEEIAITAVVALRFAAVFMAGPIGSMAFNAMAISQAAGILKAGTLGKIPWVNDILTFTEIAGATASGIYAAGGSFTNYATNEIEKEGVRVIAEEIGGDIGRAVGTLLVAGTAALIRGDDAYKAIQDESKKFMRTLAVKEVAESVGGPYATQIAEASVDAAEEGSFDPSKINYSIIPKGYSFDQFTKDLKNAYGDVTESLTSFINSNGGKSAFNVFDFAEGVGESIAEFGENVSKIPAQIVEAVENLDYPTLSLPEFPELRVPDVTSPEFNFDVTIDWEKVFEFISEIGLRALYRRKYCYQGKCYMFYVLENGEIYYVLQRNYGGLLLAGMIAAAAVVGLS